MEDITKESFKNMSSEELKSLIQNGLLNTRKKAYVYDTNNFGTDFGIELKVDFEESDKTQPVADGNLRIVAAPQLTNPAIPMGTVLSGGQPVRSSNGSMVGSPTQNPALKAPAGGKGANATPQSAIAQLTGMKGIGGK